MASSKKQRRRRRVVLFALGPLVLASYGGYVYVTGGRYVETENAYVKFDILPVSANVEGRVVDVAVAQNRRIGKGAILFKIDDRPFRISVADANAELEVVRSRIRALVATYRQTTVELLEARERTVFFEKEHARQKKLRARGVATASRYEKAELDLSQARQREQTLKEKVNVALEELGGYPNRSPEKHALYLRARAKLDQALLDLRDTVVRAPFEGVVSNLRLQVGHHVKRGDKLFSLISTERVWIEANLKETQLTTVRVGQPAEVVADAMPNVVWRARVESIARATGAEFAILPPQNASGNWVKVVRRLTVRLTFEKPEARRSLRSGMSVRVRIDTGRERWPLKWFRATLGGKPGDRLQAAHGANRRSGGIPASQISQ
ncbi:MAG: HlyD family secretion protein [Alphaproteobacteria bacterium]|nr:HlyD family secretion protein [Alphaproteobacteria bacterium]